MTSRPLTKPCLHWEPLLILLYNQSRMHTLVLHHFHYSHHTTKPGITPYSAPSEICAFVTSLKTSAMCAEFHCCQALKKANHYKASLTAAQGFVQHLAQLARLRGIQHHFGTLLLMVPASVAHMCSSAINQILLSWATSQRWIHPITAEMFL